VKRSIAVSSCLAMIAGAAVLAGCGAPMEEGEVIRVTRNIGGREGFRRHFETWSRVFAEQNPGWRMELIDLGNAEGSSFYKSRIATGDLPEVIMVWEMTNFLADGGHLIPLPDSFYEKFGIALPPPYKGKRYTSQPGLQIQGVAINKKMWADIGVTEPPETWDAYFAAFEKLKERGYQPVVLGGFEWSASQPLSYIFGADMYQRDRKPGEPSWTIKRDRGEITFLTDPVARKAIETMIQLVESFVPEGASSDGYDEEKRDFYGGKGATWFMGCWLAGDLEPEKVDVDIDYWPVPSLLGNPPAFIRTSGMPSGWAITTSAVGEKHEKAVAVLEAFYDPVVYQAFLNGEGMMGAAGKVPATRPQYEWPPAQQFIENMAANHAKYGDTLGFHIALDDMVPPAFFTSMMRVMQEIMAGNRDIDALLGMLDQEWVMGRKGT